MGSEVVLRKKGFYSKRWSSRKQDYVMKRIDTENGWDLLQSWKYIMEIEKGVLTGDLFKLLQKMDAGLLTVIEMLVDSNIKPYLSGLKRLEQKPPELKSVEIYSYVELQNHEDPKMFDLESATSCHGVGKKWKEGEGNTYAIEFTPWGELWDLPLQLRPYTLFCRTIWKDSGKKYEKGSLFGGRRIMDIHSNAQEKVRGNITLGNFFEGFTGELSFFSSPQDQSKQKGKIDEAVKSIPLLIPDGISGIKPKT